MYRDACGVEEGSEAEQALEVWQVNARLDELAAHAGSFQHQCRVITWLLAHSSPRCMALITYVLLKDVSVGNLAFCFLFPLLMKLLKEL